MSFDELFKKEISESIELAVERTAERFAVKDVSEVLTLEETAAYFKFTKHSILRWIRSENNPLPVHYFGDSPRFYLSELKDWSARNAARKLGKPLQIGGEQ